MANSAGLRSLWQQLRRGFRAPVGFEVRYRSLDRLRELFAVIGPTSISVDCFFGLGLRASDIADMHPAARLATRASEVVKRAQRRVPALLAVADSVLCESIASHRSSDVAAPGSPAGEPGSRVNASAARPPRPA
jgi:hypothetical protein